MKSVYLAGPISGCSYEGCTDWREYAKRELSLSEISGTSPMRAKNYLSKEKSISDSYETVLSCSKGITTRDRYDVRTCDILLANLLDAKKVSIGTIGELFWADAFRKPIITIIENRAIPTTMR